MKQKLVLAAFLLPLTLAPAVAGPGCSGMDAEMSTSQCMEGQIWDPNAQTCIDVASS
jgi:hypothetical protein